MLTLIYISTIDIFQSSLIFIILTTFYLSVFQT
eukprot:UN11597